MLKSRGLSYLNKNGEPALMLSNCLVVFETVQPIHPVVRPVSFLASNSTPYETPLPLFSIFSDQSNDDI